MFLGGQRWRKKWPRTAQGTDAWMLGTGTGMGLGRQAGRASTRESPLVHCALCVWCVVRGTWYVVHGTTWSSWLAMLCSPLMSPASSIRKMQKLLMNIYKLISSLRDARFDVILDPLPFHRISLCRCRRITSKRIRSRSWRTAHWNR